MIYKTFEVTMTLENGTTKTVEVVAVDAWAANQDVLEMYTGLKLVTSKLTGGK